MVVQDFKKHARFVMALESVLGVMVVGGKYGILLSAVIVTDQVNVRIVVVLGKYELKNLDIRGSLS